MFSETQIFACFCQFDTQLLIIFSCFQIYTGDIEDGVDNAAASSNSKNGIWRKFLKPRQQQQQQQQVEEQAEETAPPFVVGGSAAQLKTFLIFHHRKWQLQRHRYTIEQRGRRMAAFNTSLTGNAALGGPGGPQPQASIGLWMRGERRALAKSPWHIIQVCQSYQVVLSQIQVPQPSTSIIAATVASRVAVPPVPFVTVTRRTLRAEPGIFDMWIICAEQLKRVKVRVRRRFYINSLERLSDNNESAQQLQSKIRLVQGNSLKLPRSRPTYFLYEFQLDEADYEARAEHFRAQLLAPCVEGIYESNVPPLFRILAQCGCVCRVRHEAEGAVMERDARQPIDLDELEPLPCTNSSLQALYSTAGNNNSTGGRGDSVFGNNSTKPSNYLPLRRYVYLYEQASSAGRRALYGLFLTAVNKVHVFVLDTVRSNAVGDIKRKITTLVEEIKAYNTKQKSSTKHKPYPAGDYQVLVRVYTRRGIIMRELERILVAYRNNSFVGSNVLVVQGRTPLTTWYEQLPSSHEMPCVLLQRTTSEAPFADALQWQRRCADEMCRSFVDIEVKLRDQTQSASFFGIPLGNIPADHTLLACDILYARYLTQNNVILWATNAARPDLGGKKLDDVRLLTDDEDRVLEVNRRGCYDTITFRLDVEYAAVNAILQQQHIYEGEGTQASIAFDNAPQQRFEQMLTAGSGAAHHNAIMATMVSDFDEKAQCATAARVLRQMLFDMVRLTTDRHSVHADQVLVNFYRWLRSPASLLYDPALHRMLTQLQRKMLMQLLAEYRALGCDVVYANSNTIIIATRNKYVRDDALTYVEYAAQGIKAKPQFSYLEIRADFYWYFLLWWDPANYRGFIDGDGLADDEIITDSANKLERASPTKVKQSVSFEDDADNNDDVPDDDGDEPDVEAADGFVRENDENDVVDDKLNSQRRQKTKSRRNDDFDDDGASNIENEVPESADALVAEDDAENSNEAVVLDGTQYEKIIDRILSTLLLDGEYSMAQHLPDSVRAKFDKLISTYILHAYSVTCQMFVYNDDAGGQRRTFFVRPSAAALNGEDDGGQQQLFGENFLSSNAQQEASDKHYTSSVRKTLADYVSRDALQSVYDINRSLPTAKIADNTKKNNAVMSRKPNETDAFRYAPGMRLYDDRPALEFVKLLCEILGADKRIARDVRDLRANLLALMQIREFAPAAQFHDPHPTYVVPDVQCGACSHVRNVDICRDSNIVMLIPPADTTTTSAAVVSMPRWCCDQCKVPYDMDDIEERLLDVVGRINIVYQVQDVSCAKCHAVRSRNMGSTCDQCGCQQLETITPSAAVHERVRILASVARQFDMRILGDSLAVIIRLNRLKGDGFVGDRMLEDL